MLSQQIPSVIPSLDLETDTSDNNNISKIIMALNKLLSSGQLMCKAYRPTIILPDSKSEMIKIKNCVSYCKIKNNL